MKWIICILVGMPFLGFAQLVTNTNQSPAGLVQNVLLGPGVTVSNIQFSGSQQAIGFFDGSATNVGIDNGIVITTGTVLNNGSGPHGPNNSTNSGLDNSAPGYFRLNNLLGGGAQTYDAAVLEFDFIPYSDTVRFKYVFGSEEYMEYVGTQFNDIFAFFISGPGIPGGIQNIARLPNGDAVAINNVNNGTSNAGPCMNCSRYNFNGTGVEGPYNANPFYIQYDGFTDVLEAVSKVQCGQKYHLTIAIADVGDGIFDSGIFLEANSLSSKVPVSIEYEMSFNAFNDPSAMAEGCVSTTVTLTRDPSNATSAFTIPISVTGTATSGVDYSNTIPSSVTFQPGQTQIQFTFDALQDALSEGEETLNLIFDIPDPCGGASTQEINLTINDVAPVTVTLADTSVLCAGSLVELVPVVSGGVGPYVYSWSNGETSPSILVSPTTSTTYSVSVTDDCLNQTATDNALITVPVYPPISLVASDDITEICPYIPADLTVSATGGSGVYTYQWTANGQVIGSGSTQSVTPSTTTVYQVLVTDQCEEQATESVVYTITSPPLVVTMSPNALICPGDSVFIEVFPTGGFGNYFYDWQHSTDATAGVWVKPAQTTTFEVHVSDECQTFFVVGSTTVEVIRPDADFQVTSSTLFNNMPITFQNLSVGAESYQWFYGDGNTSTTIVGSNVYENPGTYYVTLVATNQLGCKDTVTKPITIEEEYWIYVPNTFTPDGNRVNNYFSVSTVNIKYLEVMIFNRWGERIFEAYDPFFEWDGTYNGTLVQDGTYIWKIKYVTKGNIEGKLVGHITLMK